MSPFALFFGMVLPGNALAVFNFEFNTTVDIVEWNCSSLIDNFIELYPVESWKKHGFFTLDYLEEINPHWFLYQPQPWISHYTLAGLYFVIMVCGLGGNGLVIYLIKRFRSLRTPGNRLLVNLAVSDLLMMVKMPLFIYNSIYGGPALGAVACRLYGFIGGLSGTCSICTLSAISLDRYFVIKFPLHRKYTNMRIKVSIVASWLYALTFSSIPLLDIGLGTYTPEGFLTSCSYDYLTTDIKARIFILVFFAAAWVVPFGVILFSYANILKVVLISRNITRQREGDRNSSRHMKAEEKRRQEVHLSFIVFLVILMWFASWTPYAVVSLMGIAGYGRFISPLTSMIPALFCKTASCCDPFVYALTHTRFKSELLACFGRKTKKNFGVTNRSTGITSEGSVVCSELVRVPSSQNAPALPISKVVSQCKTKWWFKPGFSNRPNSIRDITRSFSRKMHTVDEAKNDVVEEIELGNEIVSKCYEIDEHYGEFNKLKNIQCVVRSEQCDKTTINEEHHKMNEQYDKMNEQYDKMNDQYDKMNEQYGKMDEHYDKLNKKCDLMITSDQNNEMNEQ